MAARLIWPAPALLAWAASWGFFWAFQSVGAPTLVALLLACVLGVACSVAGTTPMRRWLIGLGFPVSLAVSGVAAIPAWGWLLPLAVLLLIYPINAWRDAPVFPTPAGALKDLARAAPLPDGAQVLDAGCGLGDGLKALRHSYPLAQLTGLEWSWPLVAACKLRCPWAWVQRGDIWQADWSGFDLVYLFQRPESMARAAAKAVSTMRAGAWLVSLEFEVLPISPELKPVVRLQAPDGRPVWVYQVSGASVKTR